MRIKIDDNVEIIAGDDKDVRGKVIKINRAAGTVLVEGVNKVYKHVRRSQKNPQGGRLSKEMPVQLSNVMPVCPTCDQGVRTGVKINSDGSKDRICRKCGGSLGVLSPPKKSRATS